MPPTARQPSSHKAPPPRRRVDPAHTPAAMRSSPASPPSAAAPPVLHAIAPSSPGTPARRCASPRCAATPVRSSTALGRGAAPSPAPQAPAPGRPRSPRAPRRRDSGPTAASRMAPAPTVVSLPHPGTSACLPLATHPRPSPRPRSTAPPVQRSELASILPTRYPWPAKLWRLRAQRPIRPPSPRYRPTIQFGVATTISIHPPSLPAIERTAVETQGRFRAAAVGGRHRMDTVIPTAVRCGVAVASRDAATRTAVALGLPETLA